MRGISINGKIWVHQEIIMNWILILIWILVRKIISIIRAVQVTMLINLFSDVLCIHIRTGICYKRMFVLMPLLVLLLIIAGGYSLLYRQVGLFLVNLGSLKISRLIIWKCVLLLGHWGMNALVMRNFHIRRQSISEIVICMIKVPNRWPLYRMLHNIIMHLMILRGKQLRLMILVSILLCWIIVWV